MKEKVVVIYSGGMDSFTLINLVAQQGYDVFALSFNYGQRHKKELEYAAEVCNQLNINHKIVDVQIINDLVQGSALTTGKIKVPEGHYADPNMKLTVVPNRNMIMLSLAIGYAVSIGATKVFYGAHAGDHAVYMDCRPEFVDAMKKAARIANYESVEIEAPFLYIDKGAILKIGLGMDLDYSKTWTCYNGREKACGRCGSCIMESQKVLMSNSTWKNIEDVKIGDTIKTFNEHTFNYEIATVLDVLDQGIGNVYKHSTADDSHFLYMTQDHEITCANKGKNKIGWRELQQLRRKDAKYYTYIWDQTYSIKDIKSYCRGYLLGLVDSDGNIDRGISVYQKDEEVLNEFIALYDKIVSPTKMTILERGSVSCVHGGYAPKFIQETMFNSDDNDYLLGYIAGFIIGDGCIRYVEGSQSVNCFISQRADNFDILSKVKNALNVLNIEYTECTELNKGENMFREDGVMMTTISFRKCWRIPFVFGGQKRNKIQQILSDHYDIKRLNKTILNRFDQKDVIQDVHLWDLKTTSGTYICEGFVVHNCNERLEAFAENNTIDPLKYENSGS